MKEVTIKDIAKKVGCSANTVSLALNDSSRISVQTKQKILEVAKQMNYVPNNLARSLVSGKTKTIGLILRNISSTLLVTQARKIELYLSKLGYSLSIVTSQDKPEIEKRALNVLLSNKVDGILLNTIYSDNIHYIEHLRESGYPIVLTSGFFMDRVKVDAVYPDQITGAYLSTKHLLDCGHRKVGFIYNTHNTSKPDYEKIFLQNPKFVGFSKALDYYHLDVGPKNVLNIFPYMDPEKRNLPEFLHQIKQYTALFASEDEAAIPFMKFLIENGFSIPDDIAISSMDNIRFAESAIVSLTSVGYDFDYISKQSVDILIDIIEGKRITGMFMDIPVQPTLYVRDSSKHLK